MKKYFPIILIFVYSVLSCLPFLINSNILTARGNDLTEFFWPIFYFVKESILKHNQLPFWNNLFFSGTPLLPDPQAPIFYLPNIVFLFVKNIDSGFVLSIFLHIFAAGLGMYLLTKKGLGVQTKTSLFCAFLYISSPKLSGFIEAGHFGLIASWAWLPFVFLGALCLAKKPTFKKTIFLAITLAAVFYTHILIFIIIVISITILFLYTTFSFKKGLLKTYLYFFLSGLLTFGVTAISFLPQLSWQSATTRNLLLNNPDVYPKWISKFEFLKASISPILFGSNFIWNLDTEKMIGIGFFVIVLAVIGFIGLKRGNKFAVLFLLIILSLISLNNASPLYSLLIKMNWYILLRVSTRFWFLVVFIFILLSGLGFEKLNQIKKIRFLTYTIVFLAVIELFLTSWTRILKPIVKDTNLAPSSIYEFLSEDKGKFRVFCLERCLSQKEAAIYNLELADGYGTLQQTNYYIYSEQLSQSFYRNRYTLSIPPFEIFEYENLEPYSPNLAAFNIKYVISNHILTDKNLVFVKKFDKYLVYENEINKPRANYPITVFKPNFIQINTSNYKDNFVILSEVYNKDWRAYLNGTKEVDIRETSDKTREVYINNTTTFVNFVYEPNSFKIGFIITSSTITLIILYCLKRHD